MAFPPTSVSFLFLFFFFSCTILPSPSASSHLARLLDIQRREQSSPSVQLAAARGLLARLLPSHVSRFDFEIVSKETCGREACFIISNHPSFGTKGIPEILIQGTTGVELSAGLHWYLKHWCLAHISWEKSGGLQLSSVPKAESLPHVPSSGVFVQRPVPWSYYQNAVTSSYSYAWWGWERWEKEIDWMALQGINLPLAFNGQESIWKKVFEMATTWRPPPRYNISHSDLDDFFGGPAFLAWSRMGNLHGWGGPLHQTWLDDQLVLQKKILARMYSFGMSPVLPAFSGNVPSVLKAKFPSAQISQLGNWFTVHSDLRWCCTYLLDATDPLFVEIGKAFIKQQLKEYGRTSHIYNCDTFDENTPPLDDPNYISSLGSAIYKGMQSGDDNAVWLMQGWLFSYDPFWKPPQMKALLHSVPIGRMVVLDLFAEVKPIWFTSEQFYGVPYIWCMLHNFAGNIEMYGILDSIALGPIEARISKNSTMVGVGMSMEGIEQNPIVYDLMSEMAFHRNPVNVKVWVDQYASRRYGKHVSGLQEAWQILYHTLYNCTDGAYDKNRDVIVAFPDVDPSIILISELSGRKYFRGPILKRQQMKETTDSYEHPHLWYSVADVINALVLFLENGDEVADSHAFRYDLVDLTRQALAKYANKLFLKVIEGYHLNNLSQVTACARRFLDLVKDLDTLLSSHDGFLLGPWLESAKNLARDPEQEKQFEWNARTQLTMWFDNTNTEASLLRDYGNKYWSGLLQDYYRPRAGLYFKHMIDSLVKGENFPLEDWRRDWISLTNKWQESRNLFRVKAHGDALNISRRLYDKYLRKDHSQALYDIIENHNDQL